jgi:hypothetical protein
VRGVGAPPPAAATVVDLQFKSPEGWTTRKLEGGLLLEKTKSDFYENWAYRILILPSQPLEAPLRRTFAAAWAAFIKPTIETQIVPLPLVRRMKSGMAVAFDQDPSAKNKDGQVHHAGLYLLARGKRYVPILGLFHGLGNTAEVDKALTGIFESAVIPDAGDAPVAILDREDLVGNWNQSSYSMANYVTAAGAYAGDASIATLSYITLRPDGTVKKTFVALTAATRIREVDEGTWTLEDNLLVVNASSKTRKYRIFGAGADEKGGSFLVIAAYADTDQQADLSIPRRLFAGDWYRKEK